MTKQVFLGGACGITTWRRDIAIPALESAGITYYDPQLGLGQWTTEREADEMRTKAEADVLLFVISGNTRGVATIGEVAYAIGSGRKLALSIEDLNESSGFDGIDDLNRGRIFVRSMAAAHGIPVFAAVEDAVQRAVTLARRTTLNLASLRRILDDITFRDGHFLAEEIGGGFLVQLCLEELDADSGVRQLFHGRQFYVSPQSTPNEVVRTAFKAVLTWEEHEARHRFTYRGAHLFSPHCDIEGLLALWNSRKS